jgi:TatD DNase family protein
MSLKITPEFVDTHCHLNHPNFDADRQDVLARAETARVTRLLCIGYDRASSRRAAELTADARIYAAIGIHPESADEWSEDTAAEMTALYANGKVAAYGEIGLDYHWDTVPREAQQKAFAAQIVFAQTLRPTLPLIIHNRDALTDVLAILNHSETKAPVVMHCFTGDVSEAQAILDAGHWLGIGGVATFKRSEAVREAIAFAPMERLLLETDCPYLAPQFQRGRRNEPSYLPAIAETLAAVKGISIEEVASVTSANARSLFGLR